MSDKENQKPNKMESGNQVWKGRLRIKPVLSVRQNDGQCSSSPPQRIRSTSGRRRHINRSPSPPPKPPQRMRSTSGHGRQRLGSTTTPTTPSLQHQAARRAKRAKSVDSLGLEAPSDSFTYLAEANAKLSMKLIQFTDQLDAQKKEIDLLRKRDTANQQLIKDLQGDLEKKEEHIARLREELEHAVNVVDPYDTTERELVGENTLYGEEDPLIDQKYHPGPNSSDDGVDGAGPGDGELKDDQDALINIAQQNSGYRDMVYADADSTEMDSRQFNEGIEKTSTPYEIQFQNAYALNAENGAAGASCGQGHGARVDEIEGNGLFLLNNAIAFEEASAPPMDDPGVLFFIPNMGLDAVVDADERDIPPLGSNDAIQALPETEREREDEVVETYYVVTDDGIFPLIFTDDDKIDTPLN